MGIVFELDDAQREALIKVIEELEKALLLERHAARSAAPADPSWPVRRRAARTSPAHQPQPVTWRDGVHLTGTPIWCDARRRRDVCFVSSADRVGRAGHGQLIGTPLTLALLGAAGRRSPRGAGAAGRSRSARCGSS